MLKKKQMILYSIAFMLPAITVVMVIDIIPIFQNFKNSFYTWDMLEKNMKFVGLNNFISFFKTEGVNVALPNTLIYAGVSALLKNLAGLGLALIFNSVLRTRKILRACILSTTMVSLVISGFTWRYLYSPTNGVGSILANALNLPFLNQDWLGNTNLVLYSVMFVSVWQAAGKYMVIYLAGLQIVPIDLYEASVLDGANRWHKFRHVTLPMITPSITIGFLNAIIQGLKVFDEIFAMTKGGPGYASSTMTSIMYQQTFFSTGKAGIGSAISVVLFIIVIVTALLLNHFLQRRENAVYG